MHQVLRLIMLTLQMSKTELWHGQVRNTGSRYLGVR